MSFSGEFNAALFAPWVETKASLWCWRKMGCHFPPDKLLQERAVTKLREILLQKTWMERFEPVLDEMKRHVSGLQKIGREHNFLPAYCYNILNLYNRTIFKTFSPLSEVIKIQAGKQAAACKTTDEAKECLTIDWEKLGSVFAMGERCLKFLENEAEPKLKRDGLLDLTDEQNQDLHQCLFGDRWVNKKMAELQAMEPGTPVEEITEKRITVLVETIMKAVPDWHQKAGEWEPGAVTKYHAGIAKGSADFLDENGELTGERKIKLRATYGMLLLIWPEIQEMINANPPKRMEDLWDWLRPFSYAGWIEIKDRVCPAVS